jgi:isoleucyl-tRNA synthetase
MVNVKDIEFGEVASKLSAKPDYSSLGPKFGGSADEVADKIESLEHDQVEQLRDLGEIELDGYDVELDDVEVRSETRGDAHSKTFEAGEVFIDLEETEELVEEAFVNEVIRAIQEKRKEAGLEVHDEIKLSFEGEEDVLEDYLDDVRDRMEVEEIVFGESLEYSGKVEHRGLETRFSFSEPVN